MDRSVRLTLLVVLLELSLHDLHTSVGTGVVFTASVDIDICSNTNISSLSLTVSVVNRCEDASGTRTQQIQPL